MVPSFLTMEWSKLLATKTKFHAKLIEADHKAKRLETELQNQFIRDRNKIGALEKERDNLQLNVSEQRKHVLELQNAQIVLKRKLNANEDKYLNDVLNLEEELKRMKMCSKVHVNVCDTEKILEDAIKSQIKMEIIELSFEQKYFSSVSTTSETSSNASTSSSLPTTMSNSSKLMKHFHKMETEFEKLFTHLEINSTPKSIFYTSREDIILNDFDCKEVKPILNDLHLFFNFLLKQFLEEVKIMMDVFESMESDIDATWKQNKILNNQLLEATLKHDVEKCVLMCNDFVNDNSLDEIENVKRESIDVQENLLKQINILENNFQRCKKQCIDYELQLQHQNEKNNCESSLKNLCETSWISKVEKLENENVSLAFQVQSLVKECENIKLEYQKLFNSIKKTRIQTQGEINELIENVNQKTYAYEDVQVKNQDLLITISKLKAKLKYAEKAKDVLCVSCDKNVLTLCPDKCLEKYKLNVHSKARRSLFTTPTTAKPKSLDATPVVAKTRLSKIVLWIVDSGCSKHMTDDLKLLKNFVEKFMGTISFGNDHFAAITGYSDYVHCNITICHVYYVEGLGHNLFSVGLFCDGDLEVAFQSKTYMAASSPVYLMSKATSTKSWLWHRRLSHMNFGTVNNLTQQDLVDGLPKPMRAESINGKKCILVIVDDYSRYMWVYFLQIKDEAPEMIKKFISQAHYEKLDIMQQFSIARKPQQNNVVERRNRTLLEAARTMLIFSKSLEFLWAEAISTACFTQNRSLFHKRSLCYPTNDQEDLGKMKPKVDIGIFIGYSKSSRGFQIYNRITKKIMETIHINFDELTTTAFEHNFLEPETNLFHDNDSSAEDTPISTKEDLDNLFGPMYKEYFEKRPSEVSINSAAQTTLYNQDTPSSSSIIVEDNKAPLLVSSCEEQISLISNDEVDELIQEEDSVDLDGNMLFSPYHTLMFKEAELSSTADDPSNFQVTTPVQPSTYVWTKAHPLDQVISDPSRPVMIRGRLITYSEVYMYALTMSTIEPKNIKEAMPDHSWIESLQDDLHQFQRLDVWELVPRPTNRNVIIVKWL
ncbi:retrovirus-related pol polyprotein from transposon TNT 1-94 [Tanacetum coccineum]